MMKKIIFFLIVAVNTLSCDGQTSNNLFVNTGGLFIEWKKSVLEIINSLPQKNSFEVNNCKATVAGIDSSTFATIVEKLKGCTNVNSFPNFYLLLHIYEGEVFTETLTIRIFDKAEGAEIRFVKEAGRNVNYIANHYIHDEQKFRRLYSKARKQEKLSSNVMIISVLKNERFETKVINVDNNFEL